MFPELTESPPSFFRVLEKAIHRKVSHCPQDFLMWCAEWACGA